MARPDQLRGQVEENLRRLGPVVCVRNSYSLDRRRADESGLVDLCGGQGIAFVPFFTASRLRREAAAAAAVGQEHNARVRSVAAPPR
ncbi:hypothetical protein [Streptomyces sp. MST-110588]|uniref:hypothetical protein n=1 Tax=Streptomyces sp. MST-110588 TaxID=2833628 RepID=UPI001F5E307B|nr:hypothetical protein [Streptomyces sp. MST-110588]